MAGARLARRFAEIVREEVQSAGGELLELRGDEALAVFKSPRLALRSAVALQARLDKETVAEPGLPLRVGIGLDVGEAVTFEGGYRGGALNLAARLCSLAGPGDVLASEGVIHLARKVEGLRYLDRRARLKGIAEPVRFVRVVPEELGGERQPRWRELASRRRESAIRRPLLSRKQLWVIAALVVVAVAVPVSLILVRGGDTLRQVGANAAGLIDTNQGRVLASVPVGGRPAGIAYYRGAIWVVNTVNGTVSRIDPRTESVHDSIDVGNSPSGLAAGEGALWVTNSEAGTVSEINPDANRVVQTIAVGNGPRGITVGAGAVWVANSLDGTVSRIDPTAGAVTRTIPVGGTPSAVTVGGGAIWVASETTGTVSRIDPASGSLLAAVTVGNGPTDVAFAAGALWVANSIDGTVSRIDAATNSVAATVHVGNDPKAIAVGADGVFVADTAGSALVQLDPRAVGVRRTIPLGNSPQALVVNGKQVWVSAAASPSSHRGGTLRVALADDNGSFDPAATYSVNAWSLMANVYDGLVAFKRAGGAAGGTIVPDLATRVPASTDGGKTYTFQIRRGILYANGEAVRPRDFRHAIERVFKIGAASNFYSGIVGATACMRSPKRCNLSKGIVTSDDAGTVTFHLVAPDTGFLYKLALSFASTVPLGTPARDLRAHPPPGTGPYKIESYQPGRAARLGRNPRFHAWSQDAQPAGYPDVIAATVIRDPDKGVDAVLRGRVDLASPSPFGRPPRRLRTLTTRYATQLHLDPLGAVFYLFLNPQRPPFNDLRARRALEYAVDRGKLTALEGGGTLGQPTCQILPPGLPGYRPYCPYTLKTAAGGIWTAPNRAEAARLVALSRTRGRRVIVATFPDLAFLARPLVATLSQLGYRPVLRTASPTATSYKEFDAVLLAWYKDYPAASDFIDPLFTCQSHVNPMNFCEPTIDAQVRRAAAGQVADAAAANALWAKIDRELVDRAAAVPLVASESMTLLSKRVENYQFNSQWGPLLDQLWVR